MEDLTEHNGKQVSNEASKKKSQAEIVQELKKQVEVDKTVRLLDATFVCFEALFAFSKQYPSLCSTIEVIHISLDQKEVLAPWQQTFIGGVLSDIIVFLGRLKELTLHHFGIKGLLAAQATLHQQKHLALVNWEHNSLIDSDLSPLGRTLPDTGQVKMVITHNLFAAERELARFLALIPCIDHVELFQQQGYALSKEHFIVQWKELWGSCCKLNLC